MSDLDAMAPRLLRSFVAVAEELHFGRAARRLHISQPPLSAQIRRLEDGLGVRLFERDRRHVALTEAGAFLLDRARHLLAEAERSTIEAARIARGEAGVLAIGYTPTATYEVLPALLRAFVKRSPGVRLDLHEIRSGLQAEALRRGRIEIGFACGPIDDPDLDERVLAREKFVVALPRAHTLAAAKPALTRARAQVPSRRRDVPAAGVRIRDLDGQPCVQVRPDIEPAWADACTRALVRAKVRLDVVQATDSKIAMLGLVAAGVGISIVSESMMRLSREGVVFRPIADLDVRVPLVSLTLPHPSPRARAFLQIPAPAARRA